MEQNIHSISQYHTLSLKNILLVNSNKTEIVGNWVFTMNNISLCKLSTPKMDDNILIIVISSSKIQCQKDTLIWKTCIHLYVCHTQCLLHEGLDGRRYLDTGKVPLERESERIYTLDGEILHLVLCPSQS